MNDTLRTAVIAVLAVIVVKALSTKVPAFSPVGQYL